MTPFNMAEVLTHNAVEGKKIMISCVIKEIQMVGLTADFLDILIIKDIKVLSDGCYLTKGWLDFP